MSFFSFLFAPSNSYDVRKIERGATKEQVLAIFGKPEHVTTGTMSAETWEYTVPFRIYTSIDFDSKGHVSRTYRSGEPC